jgi:hypothetical protein
MKTLSLVVLIFGLMPLAVLAEDEASPAPGCEEAITVFQDVSAMGRKNRAAKNITKMHIQMAIEGWRFKDMEVYTENGDLEGFYLSYTRLVSCELSSGD